MIQTSSKTLLDIVWTGLKTNSFIFVHGLSGHAYNTFNCKAPDHRHSKMWARDLLPQVLDCRETPGGYCKYNGIHKHGRYSTFGYQAKVLDPDDVPVSIEDSARALLNDISLLRPKVMRQD